jgi:hypothetical protein
MNKLIPARGVWLVTSWLGTGKSLTLFYSVAITWIEPVLLLAIIHDLTIVADLLHVGTIVVETHVPNE